EVLRLGTYPCRLVPDTLASKAYSGENVVNERHRHHYEFNPDYDALFTKKGMVFSGTSPDEKFVEIMELESHPWFVACQFHPEFKSRPTKAQPLLEGFIGAAVPYKN